MTIKAWAQAGLQRLRDSADSPRAHWLLFMAAAFEILILPLPIDALLIPWMLARPRRGFMLAGIALAGNLLAALAGYGIGAWAMDGFGHSLLTMTGASGGYAHFVQEMSDHGFWAIAMVAFTPIPFQIALLGAGAAHYPLVWFLLACALGRGARFFGLALLIYFGGEAAVTFCHRHGRLAGGIGVLLVAGAGTYWVLAHLHRPF
ncbi:YqaA family protein [Larsenimonas rhizosphaerae]|uniref:DedA family protein n=1 Tax=Larsenimonas rhizosphaerae TaxID=2944682 RepID=A0AA41ZMC1_9GAMM|nr:VTT domain-containing protein [Larsenimonas rhizosphaerae]MCX2524488.1 DedA family protein [Larsenimonas rhizosphaerae]